jgi:hypothetical protein
MERKKLGKNNCSNLFTAHTHQKRLLESFPAASPRQSCSSDFVGLMSIFNPQFDFAFRLEQRESEKRCFLACVRFATLIITFASSITQQQKADVYEKLS